MVGSPNGLPAHEEGGAPLSRRGGPASTGSGRNPHISVKKSDTFVPDRPTFGPALGLVIGDQSGPTLGYGAGDAAGTAVEYEWDNLWVPVWVDNRVQVDHSPAMTRQKTIRISIEVAPETHIKLRALAKAQGRSLRMQLWHIATEAAADVELPKPPPWSPPPLNADLYAGQPARAPTSTPAQRPFESARPADWPPIKPFMIPQATDAELDALGEGEGDEDPEGHDDD